MSDSKKLQCPGCLHFEHSCQPREWEGVELDHYCDDCFVVSEGGELLIGFLTAFDQDRLESQECE